jgi:hypothetical protein
MKKLLLIIGYVVGSLILLYFLLNIAWSFQTKKKLNIYILDKTVTSYERQEHKSFVWILNNSRYVRPDDKSYSVSEDYYGFYPIDIKDEVFDYKSVRINEIDAFASVYDAAYYTDCYGVYSFEWYKGKAKQIRSQKVFGGLTQNDYLFLKEMKENGRLIIGEYNMFSTPTNALLRSKTEDIYGVEWTGWSGKYYSSFDPNQSDGPPEWMPNLYENQNKTPWPTNELGIVLLSNDGLIEVLVNSQHLNNSLPKIVASDESVQKYGIANQIGFEHWFEFVTVDSGSLIQANFKIDANEEGTKIFQKIGLKTEFPAIIKSSEKDYIYYFAGDFCDNPAKLITSKIIGGKWLNNLLYKYTSPNQSTFFKDFYTPLINSILNDYYQYNEKLKVSK